MSKLTTKTAAASVVPDDVIAATVTPTTVPASRKVTLSNLVKSIKNLSAITGAAPSDIITVAQAVAQGRKLTWDEAMLIGRAGSGVQIGSWHEDGGSANGVWSPLAVQITTGGTATVRNAGDISGDPQCRRFDAGYAYSGSMIAVASLPGVVKFRVKLAGGSAGMDMQMGMAAVVPSGLDAAEPGQHYMRFRLFDSQSDAVWQAQMNNPGAGAGSDIAATSIAYDGLWHWFEIRWNPSSQVARFYIDGNLEATLSTASRYPGTNLGPIIYTNRASGTGQYLYAARTWVAQATM